MKTKAEIFSDHVRSILMRSMHPVKNAPAVTAVWSLLRELEQASRAAAHIPKTLSAEEAARQFVNFIYEIDAITPDSVDAPTWLRSYVIAELEISVSGS